MNEQDRLLAVIDTLEKKSQAIQPMAALIDQMRLQTAAITRLADKLEGFTEALMSQEPDDSDEPLTGEQYLGSGRKQ